MNQSLNYFTNQYRISKTLRFALIPQGKTQDWIKKHNIIGTENDHLAGKDINRAKHYKYAKKLIDKMHTLFIDEVLKIDPENPYHTKLYNKIEQLSKNEDLIIDNDLCKIFKNLFDKKANQWHTQYREEMPTLWRKDIEELNEKIKIETNNKKIKGFKSAIKAITKKIEEPCLRKKGIDLLYSNEDTMMLLEWKVRTGAVTATFNELEQEKSDKIIPTKNIIEFLRSFNQFYTYFSGFNENRKNVYDLPKKESDIKSTSIIYRLFKQNFTFHLENIQKWQKIKKSLETNKKTLNEKKYDWQSQLAKLEETHNCSYDELFSVKSFLNAFNQNGIDKYNKHIGGYSDIEKNKKTQGINEFINLCRQQAGANRNQFPPMQELYKQILSKQDKRFMPSFEDDKDMFNAIKDFHHNFFISKEYNGKNFIENIIHNFNELAKEAATEPQNIFITKDKIHKISVELTGSWINIDNALLEQLTEKKFYTKKIFSIKEIDNAIKLGIDNDSIELTHEHNYSKDYTLNYFKDKLSFIINEANTAWNALEKSKILEELEKIDNARINPQDKGTEQIALLKTSLDSMIELSAFIRSWNIGEKEKTKEVEINNAWYQQIQTFSDNFPIISLYNMTRNHITKKPYSLEKIKVNFENSTLLNGWDRNKETDNAGVLFEKEGKYFLGIMAKEANKLFEYMIYDEDSEKIKFQKTELAKKILAQPGENYFKKINYKLLPGPNKMLPKVFFGKKNLEIFRPDEKIIKIKENKLYTKENVNKNGKQDLVEYIKFCIKSLTIHPEWSKAYGFTEQSFRKPTEYDSIDQFYKEVEEKGYTITFDNIKESYINKKVEEGELYLFQIYNKDFSTQKKKAGNDNLHTSYWKLLFSEDNLREGVLKLNGQAEIFFRPASIKWPEEIMQHGHHTQTLKKKFDYPIIKDKRFTKDTFLFHCPITLNFKAPSIPIKFNNTIRSFLKNNKNINIIGIDRGEKHLLYYSVINQKGEILEQDSLNCINNGFKPNNETETRNINYHDKLNELEKQRDQARKNWNTIENIKEMKAGYLSQVIHKLALLIIKHNAIVVMEDLNLGFKRGRFAIEKQVYQKFEKALIEKLNYLVLKGIDNRLQAGHYLNAYQLTNKFESFQKLGKQCGILFYTSAAYTSTTDPITGFMRNVYYMYSNVEKSIEFWKSFDAITYNNTTGHFDFSYTLGKIKSKTYEKQDTNNNLNKRSWTVCSCVERSRYIITKNTLNHKNDIEPDNSQKKGYVEIFFVTDSIKKALSEEGIDFQNNPDIKAQLINRDKKQDSTLHKTMIYYFNAILRIRVANPKEEKGSDSNDYILSPVTPYFDSRKNFMNLPKNSDANGAYNIARKGICILDNINNADNMSKVNPLISKLEWQNYCQKDSIIEQQIKKI